MRERPSVIDYFDTLRAEHEEAWLHAVFVPPPNVAMLAQSRSLAILGDNGSGKSALRLALTQLNTADPQPRLLVPWQPTALPDMSANELSATLFTQAMARCARELLRVAGEDPERWRSTQPWVTETTTWLLATYLPQLRERPQNYLGRFAKATTSDGAALQAELASRPIGDWILTGLDNEQVVGELAGVVTELGFRGAWLVVDGLERMAEQMPDSLGAALFAFCSTLEIFEQQEVVVKLFAPATLSDAILRSSGVKRGRIDPLRLEWSTEQLTQIITLRLAAALERPELALAELYQPRSTNNYFELHGRRSPRVWLDLARSLFAAYQANPSGAPFDDAVWERSTGYTLALDAVSGRVFRNNQEIKNISPATHKLLTYLYTHRERICSRSELYFRCIRGLPHEPQPDDDEYEAPAAYANTLHVALSRLRQAIEPDPANPVFVQVIRGRGVRLEVLVR